MQALPLVSVFVGRKTDNDVCRILTLAAGVDDPTYIEFPAPTTDNPPPVGSPKWANYVKGVITHFKGMVIVFKFEVTIPLYFLSFRLVMKSFLRPLIKVWQFSYVNDVRKRVVKITC